MNVVQNESPVGAESGRFVTQPNEDAARQTRIVVISDICTSTGILEDLLRSESQVRWRNLLIGLKELLFCSVNQLRFVPYKFVGDGWVLLFDSRIRPASRKYPVNILRASSLLDLLIFPRPTEIISSGEFSSSLSTSVLKCASRSDLWRRTNSAFSFSRSADGCAPAHVAHATKRRMSVNGFMDVPQCSDS